MTTLAAIDSLASAEDIAVPDLRAEASLDPDTFAIVRRRTLLHGCKWDPQVGDVQTLSPFPLVMKTIVWRGIAAQAEQLTREAIAAEEEISGRPELLNGLGLPRALRDILADATTLTPAAGRVMRFDFHYTTEGWRISEANSDVPGGFSEASFFTSLMAEHFPGLRPAGNPGELWADTLARSAQGGVVVLLSAPGYMEDHQVIAFLAARIRERGCQPYLAKPEQIVWRDGSAHLDRAGRRRSVAAIVRFYQAEWLSRKSGECRWQNFFRGGKTYIANPALSVIPESKRFPLVWDRLATALPAWRRLLPETRDPRTVPWSHDDRWVLKTSLCNTGDTVRIREAMRPSEWLRTRWAVRCRPGGWVAQRRFDSVPVSTPLGPRHACIGVYTVNGSAAGAYARISEKPVIDFAAVDVALLLDDNE